MINAGCLALQLVGAEQGTLQNGFLFGFWCIARKLGVRFVFTDYSLSL